jgi:hypothetical protein
MMFNATFNNISVISWQSVLLVEETGGTPFFRTLQCEETKGIIQSRIIPAIKALPKEP